MSSPIKNLILFVFGCLLITACQPQTPIVTEETSANPLQLITPQVPAAFSFYDGCTHMLAYPAELQSDGAGLLFTNPEDETIQVYITVERRLESQAGLSLEDLTAAIATGYGLPETATYNSLNLTDFLGRTLPAMQAEDQVGESRVLLMVAVMPDAFLMDQVKDDVIYTLSASAPLTQWEQWAQLFQEMLLTFTPKECGGV